MAFKDLFKEDYTDIVKQSSYNDEDLTYYEKALKLYNFRLNRHKKVSDYELWMFSRLAYSNNGVNQRFIDKYYDEKYILDEFITESDGLQFYVIKSRITKDLVIAFRGTDEWVDWLTNLQILSAKKRQFDTAKLHLKRIFEKYSDYYIYLCGHSLGGALAQEMYLYFYSVTKLQLKRAVTFNSAGVRYKNDNPYENLPIYNYIVLKDIVGNSTGFHYGHVHYVKAKEPSRRMDPLKLFTHTLEQFTFNSDGSVNCIENADFDIEDIT